MQIKQRLTKHSSTVSFLQTHGMACLMIIRLSRPSLSYQYPLAREDTRISPKASLAYPTNEFDPHFILSPNVCRLLYSNYVSRDGLTGIGHPPTSLWVGLRWRNIRLLSMRQ
jgi:hypothetical protein